MITGGSKNLQERLHELLTCLSSTIDLVRTWPESDGDLSIRETTTTKLISKVKDLIKLVQTADKVVKDDATLRKSLQDCLIPLDLLDLLDHGNGLNPECFSKALLRESMGQMAGLKRRKDALEMLSEAVQSGLEEREKSETLAKESSSSKRKRDESDSEKGPALKRSALAR